MRRFLLATATVVALGAAGGAQAAVYVGSWEVDQGPSWTVVPPAYTGQEAAALLFGGTPAEYVISTVDSNPAHINDMAWISTWGSANAACIPTPNSYPCGTLAPDNAVVSTGGLYANPGDQSTYVTDWAVGSEYTNYAFRVPEPVSMALLGVGLVGLGAVRRRRG